ncbi:porin [Tistrella mobilis]|uniref:porin n=1 Tax=Tistrella mobilis TaxID=171437 RepID=UPI003556B767
MKKILLGTSAIVAAGLLAAPASAAEKIKLGLGGYYQSAFVLIDEDVENTRTDSMKQEGEIHFLGETTLDNGIKVGVNVQLEAYTTSDQVDEHYVYFEGGFGRVVLGAENSAPYLMHYSAPSAVVGHGVDSPNFFHASRPSYSVGGATVQNALASNATFLNATSDANKLTYFTPRFAGFQLGLSYTPSLQGGRGGSSGAYGNLSDNNVGAQEKLVEVGLNYVNTFGGINVAASAGYSGGSLEQEAAGFDDLEAWSLGANLGYAGFTFGGAYMTSNQGLQLEDDLEQWNVGLTYGFGPYKVGVAYADGGVTLGTGRQDELKMIEVGGTYALGPGVNLMAGYYYIDFDSDDAGLRNEANSFMVGTALSF